MFKKTLILVFMLVCILLMTSSTIIAKNYTIGILITATDCDTLVVYHDYTKFLVEKRGANAIATNAGGDSAKLVKDLENLIQMNCDAIIIGPVEAAAIVKPVEEAVKKGIAIVGLDTELVPGMLFTDFCNNFVMGANTAMYLAEYISGEGKIAKLFSNTNLPHRQRTKSFEAVMTEYPNIKVVGEFFLDWKDTIGDSYNFARDIILANPDIKAFWSSSDIAALGVARAIKESGKDIIVSGIDGNQANRAALRDPKSPIVATCYEDARALTDWVVEKTFEYLETGKAPIVKVNCLPSPFWTKDTPPEPFDELKW